MTITSAVEATINNHTRVLLTDHTSLVQRGRQVAADLRQHLDPVSAAEHEQRHLAEHPLLQVALREFADAAQTMLTRRHPMRNALHMVGTQRQSVRPMTTQHTSDRDRSRTDPAERVKSCGTGMHGGCPGVG